MGVDYPPRILSSEHNVFVLSGIRARWTGPSTIHDVFSGHQACLMYSDRALLELAPMSWPPKKVMMFPINSASSLLFSAFSAGVRLSSSPSRLLNSLRCSYHTNFLMAYYKCQHSLVVRRCRCGTYSTSSGLSCFYSLPTRGLAEVKVGFVGRVDIFPGSIE